jgi:hypothetical protein
VVWKSMLPKGACFLSTATDLLPDGSADESEMGVRHNALLLACGFQWLHRRNRQTHRVRLAQRQRHRFPRQANQSEGRFQLVPEFQGTMFLLDSGDGAGLALHAPRLRRERFFNQG